MKDTTQKKSPEHVRHEKPSTNTKSRDIPNKRRNAKKNQKKLKSKNERHAMKTTRLSQEFQNMSDTERHAMRRKQMGQNGSARDRLDPEWLRMKKNGPKIGPRMF